MIQEVPQISGFAMRQYVIAGSHSRPSKLPSTQKTCCVYELNGFLIVYALTVAVERVKVSLAETALF